MAALQHELRDRCGVVVMAMLDSVCSYVIGLLEQAAKSSSSALSHDNRELVLGAYVLLTRWVVAAPWLIIPTHQRDTFIKIKMLRVAVEGTGSNAFNDDLRTVAEVLHQILLRHLGNRTHLHQLSCTSSLVTEAVALNNLAQPEDSHLADSSLIKVFIYRGVIISLIEYTIASGEDKSVVAILRDPLGRYVWRLDAPIQPEGNVRASANSILKAPENSLGDESTLNDSGANL